MNNLEFRGACFAALCITMWIVRLALRRPYTIAVGCALILILGLLSLSEMLVDIFPVIDIPVVAIVWNYPGLPAEEMERRVVLLSERAMSTTVSGIQRVESESIPGIGLLRVYFEQGTDIGGAIAQIAAVSSTVLRAMPPGMQAPNIVRFNASNVPVAQMTISSDSLPEEKLFDYGLNFIRIRLFTIPGLSTPAPYGGKQRQINIDVDPQQLLARGLSPDNVVSALNTSNIIMPAGTARIGREEFNITMNSSPSAVEQFNNLPIRVVGRAPITLGDIAQIKDSFADQTNIVRIDGKRATYLNILKKADASTLDVVNQARDAIPDILAAAPKGMKVKLDFDQSTFVSAAITSVIREALISAFLVAVMILFFLGSWRSVITVCTSIPLAILASIVGLKLTGNSINIMTLGGLSLAIGMLVDDATVAVENIHRHQALGEPLTVAVIRGAQEIALPAIMATMAICIVFFPVVLLTGPARFLFIPMAAAVVFAMAASYLLSRTLVPLLSRMLMASEHHAKNAAGKFHHWREGLFEKLQNTYAAMLETVLAHRKFTLALFGGTIAISLALPFLVGLDFFPTPDVGIMRLHFRAPSGTRIEETEKLVEQVENTVKKIVPEKELGTINSNIGVPINYNLAFVPTDSVASMDSEILVALNEGHRPTHEYQQKLRKALNENFAGSSFYFQPADIVNQVLNFGLTSPLDVQIQYPKTEEAYEVARQLRDRIREIPGTEDVEIKQVVNYPTIRLNVDRIRAAQVGLTQRDVANSMLIALSSSSLIAPSYFLNPQNNVNYTVVVKVPLPQMSSVNALLNAPISPSSSAVYQAETGPLTAVADAPRAQAQPLGNLAGLETQTTMDEVNHNNVQRVLDVTSNVEGRDLGSVQRGIYAAIKKLGKLPQGMKIAVLGQGQVMNEAFEKLGLGLILAIVLVYLLMAVLFQSWLDPFIVMVAIPGALVGIGWILLATGTTINVNSFMGSIMSVGIAASNAILLVSYANEVRIEKKMEAFEAALEAGKTRLRPVLMTALAMIIGMLPTALALGEGGEQNAPLGRAVIGGLVVATFTTLFVVPVVYSLLRKELPTAFLMDKRLEAEEQGKQFNLQEALSGSH